eukprot:gene1789-33209_t
MSDFMLHGSDIQRLLEGQLQESTMQVQLLQRIVAQPGLVLPQIQMQQQMPTGLPSGMQNGVQTGMQLGQGSSFQSMKSQVPTKLVSPASSDIRFPRSMLSHSFSAAAGAANNQQAAAAPIMQPRRIPVGLGPLPSQLQAEAHGSCTMNEGADKIQGPNQSCSGINNHDSSSPNERLPLRRKAYLNSCNQAEGLGSTSGRQAKRQHTAKVPRPESKSNKVQGSSTKNNQGSSNESGQSLRNSHENAAKQFQCQPTSADGEGSGGTGGSNNNPININICTNNNSSNADEMEGPVRPYLGSSPHESCSLDDGDGVKRGRNCNSSGAVQIQYADDVMDVDLNHPPRGGNASCSGGDANDNDCDAANSEGISSRQEDTCHRPKGQKGQKRLFWTPELHQRFLQAMFQLGVNNAAPKYIMRIMSVKGLKRENVASHLQRYRQYLKRIAGVPQKATVTPDQLQQAQGVVMRDHARRSGFATGNVAPPSQPPLVSSMGSSMSGSACGLIQPGNFRFPYNSVPANFPTAGTMNPILVPQSQQLPMHLQNTLYPPVAPVAPPLPFSQQPCLPSGLSSMQQFSMLGADEQQALLAGAGLHQQIRA